MKSRSSLRKRGKGRVLAESLEPRFMLAANLVISEFMASNKTTLQDAAGDFPDWIEIHNLSSSAVNLNNYYLTDNANTPEMWRFPVQNLAAGGYLVVFADSTSTPPVANTELHTNFSLSASGEYLGLINAADDSVAFAYAPTFPPQTADVSYGLANADDPNSQQEYFSVPTPGAPNQPSAAYPVFSQPGKVFTGTLSLTLTDSTPGAVIHYTTDDSVPTASSPTYTTALSITQSEAIRVIAVASGLANSPVTSQTYERVDSTVTSVQNQNLPVIIIDTYGATMNESTDIAGSATVMNTTNGLTNILGTADYQGRIGIHIRGSTSESYPKQQYLLDLWDDKNEGQNASLLGMPSDDSWVLYAPYTELSMMQNPLAFSLANQMGEYASRTQYVEVYMSTGGNSFAANTSTINYTSNYMGIYILEEKIKIDSGRVDVDEMSASNPNGGFIVDQDRYSGEDFFTTPQGVHMVLDDPDDTSLESNISTAWDSFENALFTGSAGPNQPWDTPGNADYYGNFINVGTFVDYYLLEEMTRNVDAFWLSTYYTKAADTVVNGTVTQRGLISAGPVWDFNLSLGAPNYNFGADAEGWDTDTLTPFPGAAGVSGFNPQDPYFQRLLTDPNFQQAVNDRWEQLRQGILSNASLKADIQSNVNILSDNTGVYPVGTSPTGTTSPIMRNFQKWPELGVYVTTDDLYDPSGSWINDVNLTENWLLARVQWMDSQFIPEPTLTPTGGNFGSPTSVSMTPIGPASLTDTQLIGPNSTIFYKVPTANITNWQTLNIISPTTGLPVAPSGWSTGTTGLGYDTTTTPVNFLPFINTNLQSQMLNKEADVFTLMNFNVTNPASIQALILKVQYDDGFTAWVNGVRVMDANSPENVNPVFNTTAAGSGDDTLAITFREFDISAIKGLLKPGNNTLAIQGMNSGTGSADFLLTPTLYTRTFTYPSAGQVYYTTDGTDPRTATGGISASAKLYSAALAISSSTKIQARTLINGQWSALNTEVYDFNSSALRVTELMYNPPPLPGFSTQDLEFIELENVSSSPLDLSGYQFTKGVDFTFPDQTLAPGAYAVVVKNPVAFAARYGTSIDVLGNYGSDNFSNSGETVTLVDGFGTTVESFTYSPTWYPSTAGNGDSLVVVNPTGDTSTLNTAAGWRASYAADGAPGLPDSDSVVPAATSFSVYENGAGLQPTIAVAFDSTISAGSPAAATVVNAVTGASLLPIFASFNGSTITFTLPASTPSGDYLLTIPAAQVFNVSGITAQADITFNFLLVRSGQSFAMPPLSNPMTTQRLVIGTGGTLDLGGDTLIINDPTLSVSTIQQLLASGYKGGNWNGTGIITSEGGLNSELTVGYAAGADGTVANLPAGEIMLKTTLYGDTDLNGTVDPNDLAVTLNSFQTTGVSWDTGDFDYDGSCGPSDLSLLLANFMQSVPAVVPAAVAASAATPAVAPAASPASVPAASPASAPVASPAITFAVATSSIVTQPTPAPAAVTTAAPTASNSVISPTDQPADTRTPQVAQPALVVASTTPAPIASETVQQPSDVTVAKKPSLPFWRRIARQRREGHAIRTKW